MHPLRELFQGRWTLRGAGSAGIVPEVQLSALASVTPKFASGI